ncbi:hypothetical protein D3C71_2089060 [compost metagenome]
MPAQRVVLAVGIGPFIVAVDLVGRDHDGGPGRRRGAQGVQQMDRAHDVGRERLYRLRVARADQGLRGQV